MVVVSILHKALTLLHTKHLLGEPYPNCSPNIKLKLLILLWINGEDPHSYILKCREKPLDLNLYENC